MIVIVPIDFIENRTKVISSVAYGTETDPATAWLSSLSFSAGERCYEEEIDNTPARIYEAISTVTTNNDTPSVDVTNAVPKWALVGYTNKWNMFDTTRETSTVSSTDITITLTPGERINTLAFIGMSNITEIQVTAVDTYGNTLYPTNTTAITESNYILQNLPLNTLAIFTINLNGVDTRSIEALICGTSYYIGDVQRNINIDSLNFSTIERDLFGNSTVIARRNVPKVTKTLFALSEHVDSILEVRDLLNAKAALWIGLDSNNIPEYYNSMIILGFYRTFTITMDNQLNATISLELEEI